VTDAPDFCAPVVAWRVWRVLRVGGETRLTSAYHTTQWPMLAPLEAECGRLRLPFRERHPAPSLRCRCGIYATLPEALGDHLDARVPGPAMPAVVGRVSLWGTVVECERGWRASRAYPERLYVLTFGIDEPAAWRIAEGLGGYGVPVDVLDTPRGGAVNRIVSLAA
jgi:hypothetical protein